MNLAHLTAGILITNAAGLIAYDIWVKIRQPDGNATISWVALTAAKHAPIVAGAIFLVLGHVFWQNCP